MVICARSRARRSGLTIACQVIQTTAPDLLDHRIGRGEGGLGRLISKEGGLELQVTLVLVCATSVIGAGGANQAQNWYGMLPAVALLRCHVFNQINGVQEGLVAFSLQFFYECRSGLLLVTVS